MRQLTQYITLQEAIEKLNRAETYLNSGYGNPISDYDVAKVELNHAFFRLMKFVPFHKVGSDRIYILVEMEDALAGIFREVVISLEGKGIYVTQTTLNVRADLDKIILEKEARGFANLEETR